MASSVTFSCRLKLPFCRLQKFKYAQVRSQSFSEDGKSANIVDSKMGVLRERIEEVRVKERLEKCCIQNGWNYSKCGYDQKQKRNIKLRECIEMVSYGGSALASVFLSGSICIFLVSLLLHFNLH